MNPHNTFDLEDGWLLHEFRSEEQIEAVRQLWQSFQQQEEYPSIFSDIDRYLSIWQASPDLFVPCILILYQDTKPQAMVISSIGNEFVQIKFGYKTIFKLKLNQLSVVHGGILGHINEKVSSMVLHGLKQVRDYYHLHCIHFNHLKVDSDVFKCIQKDTRFICRNHFLVIQPHWRMKIPNNIDSLFQRLSKKHRSNLRRAIRTLENKSNGNIEIQQADSNILDVISQDVEKISSKTYQDSLNAGFIYSQLMRSILKTDAELQRMKLAVIYIDEQPCAFQWGSVLREVYFLEKIGYDPKWSKESMGNVLFIKILERLCDEKHIKYFDFGFGDAQYKQSYGDQSWLESAATYLFSMRLIPIMINSLISANSAITFGLIWLTKKLRLHGWIKRMWRKRLRDVAQENL